MNDDTNGLPTTTSSTGDGGWMAAKTYTIMSSRMQKGSLDDQWSACNGCDGFGNCDEDAEMIRVRERHGETMTKLPGEPRLILFRVKRTSPLMMKLWYTRSFEEGGDVHLLHAALSRALVQLPSPRYFGVDIDLIDWDCNRPDAKPFGDCRYELSIEFISEYRHLRSKHAHLSAVTTVWRQFMKVFEGAKWA